MAKSFTAQVEQMIANSKEAMLAVVQGSIRDMTNDMQIPVAKGGRMRVDTGFLRASARASLNGMPSGRSKKNAVRKLLRGSTWASLIRLTDRPSTRCCWT